MPLVVAAARSLTKMLSLAKKNPSVYVVYGSTVKHEMWEDAHKAVVYAEVNSGNHKAMGRYGEGCQAALVR